MYIIIHQNTCTGTFNVVLFIITIDWKVPNALTIQWISLNEMWHIYTAWYYTAMMMSKLQQHATRWTDFTNNEKSQQYIICAKQVIPIFSFILTRAT